MGTRHPRVPRGHDKAPDGWSSRNNTQPEGVPYDIFVVCTGIPFDHDTLPSLKWTPEEQWSFDGRFSYVSLGRP